MKKLIVILLVLTVVLSFRITLASAEEMVWQEIGGGNLNLKSILINPAHPNTIYVGANSGVLKTDDGARSWRNILSVRGQNRAVNFLFCEPQNKNSLYAATGSGLFYSNDQGKNWKRIFKGKGDGENQCTTLAVLSSGIYLGTQSGLFISKDKGRSWRRESAELARSPILAITYHPKEPNDIYVAAVEGVFRTKDAGQSWEKIFIASATENNRDNGDAEPQEQDEVSKVSQIRYLSLDPNNPNHLYLATAKGIYRSQNKGKNWELLSDAGLLNREAKFLLVSGKSNIYALTKSGVFEYRNEQWQELSLRLMAEEINFLAQDNQDNLYVASDKGLFKANIGHFSNYGGYDAISIYSQDEPKIDAVQKAAISYAEVGSEKIKEWRKKAKMKAILPKLTVGLDRSEDTNYEIYTSATTHYVYEGPDDKSNGWDVTLSWELGDLIWSEAQTSIDVRSRLMVELRDEILDEVTKLYFERLRVKMELDNLSLEDRKKRLEKELRLQELTASLDALTGGYFSQQIKTMH